MHCLLGVLLPVACHICGLPKLGVLEDQVLERAFCVSVLAWLCGSNLEDFPGLQFEDGATALVETVCLLGEGEGCTQTDGGWLMFGELGFGNSEVNYSTTNCSFLVKVADMVNIGTECIVVCDW
jgi:hypothetical protein